MKDFYLKLMAKYPRAKWDLILACTCVFIILGALTILQKAFGDTIVDIGFGFEADAPKTFGGNPVGIVRLRQEIFDGIYVGYEHHSSVADENDRNVYDGLEIMLEAPFFRKGGCK